MMNFVVFKNEEFFFGKVKKMIKFLCFFFFFSNFSKFFGEKREFFLFLLKNVIRNFLYLKIIVIY